MTVVLKQLGIAALYALLARIVLTLFSDNGVVSIVWPSSGLALAVLLLGGKRYFWGVFLGAFLANAMTGITMVTALAIATGNTLEALIGVWLLTRNSRFDPALRSLHSYLLLALAGSIGSLNGALNGATTLLISGFLPSGAYLINLAHWWMGDVLGIALITPLILAFWHAKNEWPGAKRVAEAVLLLGLMFVAGQVIFLGWFHNADGLFEQVAKGYWMFLFIAWIAVRLGTRGTVAAINMVAVQALLGAYQAAGFFANDAQTHLINYWFYMVVLSVVGMALTTFITERKMIESELWESNNQLQATLDAVPDLLFETGLDGRIYDYHSPRTDLLAAPPHVFLGRMFSDVLSPDVAETCMSALREAHENGSSMGKQYELTLPQGKLWFELSVSSKPVDPNQEPRFIVLARDITERKKAEETIHASEARLQEIINMMPVALFIKDPASNIILMNRACEEQWGMSFPELRGTDASHFFPPEQMAFFLAKDREVFANRQLVDFEETVWNAMLGENRIAHTYKKPVFDAAGSPLYLIGMSIDITERKQAEEASRWAKQVLDTTMDGFWMIDMTGNLLEANAAYARMSGYSVDELAGMHISQLEAIENTKEQVKAHAERIIAQGSGFFETRHRRKDGHEIDVEISANFMPETQRFFVFVRDITGRKAAERQLHDLSAHILSVREEEKASIAREIHDDLGGTLTALKMETYWLSRKLPVNGEAMPLLEHIDSLSQLVDNAIDVTRRIISDLRPTILDHLGLLAALEWQCTQFHKRTGVECLIRCIEDEGDLDKQRSITLFRIFQEALTNVVRHSGATRVEVEFCHDSEKVFLSVSDNGRGFPQEGTVAASSYGILGMNERVEQLGGRIEFDSLPGSGLSVAVTLPLHAANNKGEKA